MKKISVIIIFLIGLCSLSVSSQELFQAYEQDTSYINQNKIVSKLEIKQDSLNKTLTYYRSLVEQEEDTNKYVDTILFLESEIFETHNNIASISTRINRIRQDYILKNLLEEDSSEKESKPDVNTTKYINDFLHKNLTEEELKCVFPKENVDSLMFAVISRINSNYVRLDMINDSLRNFVKDKSLADSLYRLAHEIEESCSDTEDEFAEVWEQLYETKLYAYRRILDYLNVGQHKQYDLDKEEKETRTLMQSAEKEQFAPSLFMFGLQKDLLNEYEEIIAERIGDDATFKFLSNQKKNAFTFDKQRIDLPDWDFIDYHPILFGGKGVHSSSNPVKQMILPTTGSVYNLRVFTLSYKIKNYWDLRKAHPAYYFINENGKYEYYLGLYKTLEEVEKVTKTLRSNGFRSPAITEWREGGKVMKDGMILPLHVNDYYYSVELELITPEITRLAKKIAPDKSFAKINNKYALGLFEKYTEASKVRELLGEKATIVRISKK